jgi:hypothetical protein
VQIIGIIWYARLLGFFLLSACPLNLRRNHKKTVDYVESSFYYTVPPCLKYPPNAVVDLPVLTENGIFEQSTSLPSYLPLR